MEIFAAIQNLVGEEHVRAAGLGDTIDGVTPRFVAEPGSPLELARVLATANDAGLCVVLRGNGTKLDWGNPPRAADMVMSTRRLDRMIDHAHGDMTATVQAGCSVAAFRKVLAEHGQRLALDPIWHNREIGGATIGGILAANDSGALRMTFGTLRDHLIGVTVALADGTLAKSGGKVVKNVAGYDLPKLIIGSLGTLGVITEATFRLYPVAHATQSLLFVAAVPGGLGRLLSALADNAAVTTAVQFEVEGNLPARILVLIEGLPGAIEGKVRRVCQAAASCGATQADLPADAWQRREALFSSADACVAKISVLPSRWLELIDGWRTIAMGLGVRWRLIGQSVGVGLMGLHGARPAEMVDVLKALRLELEKVQGTLVVLRCTTEIKKLIDVWPDGGDALPLMRRIKEQFDPKGTLSPGRFVGGI